MFLTINSDYLIKQCTFLEKKTLFYSEVGNETNLQTIILTVFSYSCLFTIRQQTAFRNSSFHYSSSNLNFQYRPIQTFNAFRYTVNFK